MSKKHNKYEYITDHALVRYMERGKMLGHEGSLIKKRIQEHETGRAFMHPESLQKIDLWRRCGLPEDAPSPDLGLGRQKSREIAIKKLRKKLGSDWVENK